MAAAKKSKGTVGVIGLGIMGGSFAKNLAAAGWHVVGYDVSLKARRIAERRGVEIAKSAADVAAPVPVDARAQQATSLSDVSCTAAGLCVTIGSYVAVGGPGAV